MSNIFIGIVTVVVVVGGREGGRKREEGWSYGLSSTMKALLYDAISTHLPVLLLPLPPPLLPRLLHTNPPTPSFLSPLHFGVICV